MKLKLPILKHFLNKISLILIIFAQLFLSSCLELVEEIKVNKNKSGTIIYSIESMDGGNIFSSLTSMFNISLEDQIRVEADKLVQQLLNQPGISNVEYNLNGRTGTYYVKFDFQNHQSVNNAFYAVSGNKKTFFTPGYFKISGHRFKKINFAPWLKKYLEKEEIDLPQHLIADMIVFKSVIEVPNNIRRVTPRDTKISSSNRETTQRFTLSAILANEVDTGVKIRF